jgi:predicted RNA binding protein YcfA (HicA-like mRNA interferase family)
MNSNQLIDLLKKSGWQLVRQKGSHKRFEKEGFPPITVPDHGKTEMKPGTLNAILKAAKLK